MVDSDAGYRIKYRNYMMALDLASNKYILPVIGDPQEVLQEKVKFVKQRTEIRVFYNKFLKEKIDGMDQNNKPKIIDRIDAAIKITDYAHDLNDMFEGTGWLPKNKLDYDEMIDYLLENIESELTLPLVCSELDKIEGAFIKSIMINVGYNFNHILKAQVLIFSVMRKLIFEDKDKAYSENNYNLIFNFLEFDRTFRKYVRVNKLGVALSTINEFFEIIAPLEGGNYNSVQN